MSRQSRKLEHIAECVKLADGPAQTLFADIDFLPNALPNISLAQIDYSTQIANIKLSNPLIINALTGGSADVAEYNIYLAELAKALGSAIAVGSQYSAVENQAVANTFSVVRKINPTGVIFANIGAHATTYQAQKAVDMVAANALQIHLNPAQEIIMSEGDRDFYGYLRNIEQITNVLEVPIIVKETGVGIAVEQIEALKNIGVKIIDVSGAGGTNFLAIEANRAGYTIEKDFLAWGIPTAIATLEAYQIAENRVSIISSGGIRTGLDMSKALALGADATGIAGMIIKSLYHYKNIEHIFVECQKILATLKKVMLLTSAKNIADLRRVPLVFKNNFAEQLISRGLNMTELTNRRGINN